MPVRSLPRRAVSAAVAAVVLTGCFAGGPSDPPAPPTAPPPSGSPSAGGSTSAPQTGAPDEPWDEPRDGAQLTIEESAVANSEDASGLRVSYAIVLRNPSQDVAVTTNLKISLLDANGKLIKDKVADREQVLLTANLVMPDDEQAVSNRTYTDRAVDRIKVEIADAHWVADDGRFSPVTVSNIRPAQDGDELDIAFTVHSHYQENVAPAEAYAIFRDENGQLLGGSAYGDAEQHEYRPGQTATQIEVDGALPKGWDEVEVYVDPWVGNLI